jgi:hypothetical protein
MTGTVSVARNLGQQNGLEISWEYPGKSPCGAPLVRNAISFANQKNE